MPWHVVSEHSDCPADRPWAVVKDADGSVVGCHASESEANDQMAALYANEEDSGAVEHFHAIMVTEGESTGLRTFHDLTWREPPFAFHFEYSNAAHGGQMMTVQVGNITRVERQGDQIHGWGQIDLNSDQGREYARKLVEGFSRWVSIGLDEQPFDMVVTFDEGKEATPFDRPEQIDVTGGRIGELTAVSVPALDSAIIEPTQALLDAMDNIAPQEVVVDEDVDAHTVVASGHTMVIPDCPPAEWFLEPTDVDMAGALTVTDEGRVYGYLAPSGVAHRGVRERRVTVPMGNVDYTQFMSRETIVEGGGRVVTGPITMECGHAPLKTFGAPASEHYDNSCSIVASVRVGENRHGVWIAGALLPDITAGQVARMMACLLSGDWRPHRDRTGWRELAGSLLVPVPGFPSVRTKASVTYESGELVASAVPVRYESPANDASAWKEAQHAIAAGIGLDWESQRATILSDMEESV